MTESPIKWFFSSDGTALAYARGDQVFDEENSQLLGLIKGNEIHRSSYVASIVQDRYLLRRIDQGPLAPPSPTDEMDHEGVPEVVPTALEIRLPEGYQDLEPILSSIEIEGPEG